MPLYSCDRCGFTSTAFRFDAVSGHNVEHPECPGSIRLTFHPGLSARELELMRDASRMREVRPTPTRTGTGAGAPIPAVLDDSPAASAPRDAIA